MCEEPGRSAMSDVEQACIEPDILMTCLIDEKSESRGQVEIGDDHGDIVRRLLYVNRAEKIGTLRESLAAPDIPTASSALGGIA